MAEREEFDPEGACRRCARRIAERVREACAIRVAGCEAPDGTEADVLIRALDLDALLEEE